LLVAHPASYRTASFIRAGERLGIRTVVASNSRLGLSPTGRPGVEIDFSDPQTAVERVRQFHARDPISAVLGVEDGSLEIAASVAQVLSLKSNEPQAIQDARLKHQCRNILATAGLLSPTYRVLEPGEMISSEWVGECEFPCVVKPVSLSGSRGVIRADNVNELSAAIVRVQRMLERENPNLDRCILIEKFIDGHEYAIEGVLHSGKFQCLAIFDKPDPLDGPYFEETIYLTPPDIRNDLKADIVKTIAIACRAIGLTHGPIHAECRVNSKGVWVLEVAPRTIGGQCGRLLELALGLSLEEVIMSNALGHSACVQNDGQSAGVMMIPVPGPGVLRRLEGLARARAVDRIESVLIDVHPGHLFVPWPEGSSYPGFIFAKAPDTAQVERALRQAHAQLKFVLAPHFPIVVPVMRGVNESL
jgi:biotin carboxylase